MTLPSGQADDGRSLYVSKSIELCCVAVGTFRRFAHQIASLCGHALRRAAGVSPSVHFVRIAAPQTSPQNTSR